MYIHTILQNHPNFNNEYVCGVGVMQPNELLKDARLAMEKSYSAYSHLAVGAALRTEEGHIFTGTNIENASFSLSICAERVAVFKAVSEGYRSFTDLAIVSSSQIPAFPCGACRQALQEVSPRIIIIFSGLI